MNKYENGRIYKIVDNAYTKCYVGSTCESLCKRFARHRQHYNAYTNGKRTTLTTSFLLFEEFGIENCKIELIEHFPCSNGEELRKKEGFYIREMDCVNKVVAGRTTKEYNQEYFKKNHDKVLQTCKEYRDNNKEKEQLRHQQKYQRYKEKQNARRKEKLQCPICFCQISRRYMKKHRLGKHNQEEIKNTENSETDHELN